jgi:RNA polymerase sigma factor (sigma-70 family)
MATSLLIDFVQRFRRSALLREGEEETDGQLLERVVTGRDSVALETLVRRHAPMVWGVCRRNLAHQDEAEDAFQATFLVLLRKAASIRSRELLANWLYGVAQKTARKARQMAAVRGGLEKQVEVMPELQTEPHEDEFGPELRAGLDEEVSRLPEKYRVIIVLCDLQSRTRPEVARQLRLPEGTVGSRLARGRALLAQRLVRRGLSLSATSLAVGWSRQAVGSVPAALLTKTIKAVSLLPAGQTTVAGMISAQVSLLTLRVLQGMAVAKLKKASVLLVMAALVLAGGTITYRALADQRNTTEPPPNVVEEAKADPDVEKYGSAAAVKNLAKSYVLNIRDDFPDQMNQRFSPARTFEAIMDRETHQWTVTGDIRYDHGTSGTMVETELKLVLRYNSSSRSYDWVSDSWKDMVKKWVQSRHVVRDFFDPYYGWRPAPVNNLGKWAQTTFKKPMRTTAPVSSVLVVSGTTIDLQLWRVDASGRVPLGQHIPTPPTRLITKGQRFSYSGKEVTVQVQPQVAGPNVSSSGVTVYVDDRNAQSPIKNWIFEFGGLMDRFLEVGEYGCVRGRPALLPGMHITTAAFPNFTQGTLINTGGRNTGGRGPLADFVVWEIELKDQKVVRLAIDFSTTQFYGSLRVNSLFQPSVAEPSAAE